jgi:hypothetical protein
LPGAVLPVTRLRSDRFTVPDAALPGASAAASIKLLHHAFTTVHRQG